MKLLVCALEASANLHLKEVLAHMEDVELYGIFDRSLGFEPLYDSSEFGIMGIIDAVRIYKKAKKALKKTAKLAHTCDAVLLIDSPAFNLPMAKELRKTGFEKTITYYVLPQVWAWKKKRVRKVEKYCDNLLAILPFEEQFWHKAQFVGNPLVDEIKTVKTEWPEEGPIAFLPGSRRAEISALMPVYREVAREIPGRKLLSVPEMYRDRDLEELYGDTTGFEIRYDTHGVLNEASFAFVCSGTATLEATIIAIPFTLVYKAKALDFMIGRMLVRLPFVGLANLIRYFAKEEPLHPEFLQKEVTPENLLKSYREYDRAKFIDNAVQLRQILKAKQGASANVARIIKDSNG